MDDYKIGGECYIIEAWTENIIKCIIEDKHSDENGFIYSVRQVCKVDRTGRKVEKSYGGKADAYGKLLYKSAEEAYNSCQQKHIDIQKEYLGQIKTVEDLIRFPLDHCFCGEEYTDWDAVSAYEQRAKELLGIAFDRRGK